MSFFKDFKEDLSQAVNELIADDNTLVDDEMVNTLEDDQEVGGHKNLSGGVLDTEDNTDTVIQSEEVLPQNDSVEGSVSVVEKSIVKKQEFNDNVTQLENEIIDINETKDNDEMNEAFTREELSNMDTVQLEEEFVDESAVITKGMTIIGNVESKGSVEVVGTINGDITCKGKVVVTGEINGNSKANEFFADSAKITGEIVCEGSVKIGQGSVVIGNVFGTSVVIAGAVNGDIDVKGPVIVDSSAVVVGNIKSRSVQINNGAIIEGFCSQSYAEVNVKSIFGEEKTAPQDKK